MGRLNRSLSNGMGDKEEIELSILDFTLLDEASIDVSTLRRVLDELITLGSLSLLEESLSNTLVDDDQGDLWRLDRSRLFILFLFFGRSFTSTSGILSVSSIFLLLENAVLFGNNLMELVKFLIDDHLSHGITNTISVDEDMLRHGVVEVTVTLEGTLEIVG